MTDRELKRLLEGEEKLTDALNVVLIGMPGSGKSSVGRRLAGRMGREFVDCDAEIACRAGKSIPEIFARDGERAFRDLEARDRSGAGPDVADDGRVETS